MNALKFSTLLALLIFTGIGLADPLDTWTSRNPLPTGNRLEAVAYGDGQFVAVGSGNATGLYEIAILTSGDGVNWIQRQPGLSLENRWLNGIAFGRGQFVAVGGGVKAGVVTNFILTSADGISWVQRQPGTLDWLFGIAYGNNQFLAVGDGGTILTSRDGVSWVQHHESTLNDLRLRGVTYGGGQFVAVGWVEKGFGLGHDVFVTPTILTSADGVNWVRRQAPVLETSRGLSGIAYGNDQFVAVGAVYSLDLLGIGSTILTSVDGITWVQRQSVTQGVTHYLSGIAYGNGQFVAAGGAILTSADGVNWVQRQSGLSGAQDGLSGIAYGNGHFVTVGDTILESGSIITLSITPKAGSGLLTLSLEGPTGLGYTIETSTNLISWRNLTNITSVQPTHVILDGLPASSERVFYRAYSQ